MLDGYIVAALKTFSLRILKIFSNLLIVFKERFDTNLFGIELHKISFFSKSFQSFVTIFALLKFHEQCLDHLFTLKSIKVKTLVFFQI